MLKKKKRLRVLALPALHTCYAPNGFPSAAAAAAYPGAGEAAAALTPAT